MLNLSNIHLNEVECADCGHAREYHRLSVWNKCAEVGCGCSRFREPPMTAPTPTTGEDRDRELCAKCGYTFNGHVSNTGVIYPCWTPSGKYAPAPTAPTAAEREGAERLPLTVSEVQEFLAGLKPMLGDHAALDDTLVAFEVHQLIARALLAARRETGTLRDEVESALATGLRLGLPLAEVAGRILRALAATQEGT
jgi:hypothetical protein